jgi:hypothetical protein
MILSSGDSTPFYTPSWIPLVMIVCLMAVNARQIVDVIKNGFQKRPKLQTNENSNYSIP